jgi:hypothetical protein
MANKEILFFPNGNTAVMEDGRQAPELQQPWVTLFAEFLEGHGYDPTEYELYMPGAGSARFFRTVTGGWSWRFSKEATGASG